MYVIFLKQSCIMGKFFFVTRKVKLQNLVDKTQTLKKEKLEPYQH
jgi:hypothetical protein